MENSGQKEKEVSKLSPSRPIGLPVQGPPADVIFVFVVQSCIFIKCNSIQKLPPPLVHSLIAGRKALIESGPVPFYITPRMVAVSALIPARRSVGLGGWETWSVSSVPSKMLTCLLYAVGIMDNPLKH